MIDERTVSLLRFEEPAGMPSADDRGALDELFPCAGAVVPAMERGAVGQAAVFSPAAPTALQAKDLASGGTLLLRDLTIQVLIRWDFDAQNSYGHSGAVISRGLGSSAPEYMPFALELYVVDHANGIGGVRWLWHTAAGVLKAQTGGEFKVPSGYFLITASRRWISPTSSALRYYVGDQLLVEVASGDGDIGGGVTGTTTIGTRYTGAFGNYFAGAIDELAILNYEMAAEELAATWYRINVSQPDGYRQIQALMPPGMPISSDPGSRVQRDLQAMGVAVGFADGLTENFRQNIMPDRAYGSTLREWEAITTQPPNQGDSLDVRRARVLGHLGSRAGCTVPSVEEALATVLDCQPSDIGILGFNPTIADPFVTLDAQQWFTPNGGADVTANELRLQIANGVTAAWDAATPGLGAAYSALLPMQTRPRAANVLPRACAPSIFLALDVHTLSNHCETGIVIASWISNSRLFFGLRNNGGTYELRIAKYVDGLAVSDTLVTTIVDITVVNLRLTPYAGDLILLANQTPFLLSYNTINGPWAESDWETPGALGFRSDLDWMGFYLRTVGGAAGAAGDVRIRNTSLFRDNFSQRPFEWYAYRDPALGGNPDFVGANRILQRMRHAYTITAAISSKSVLYDDLGSGYDRGPAGAL